MKDFVLVKNKRIPAEVAITAVEQAKGLMGRTSLPSAMIFPSLPKIKSFWMKNTPKPLDIVFSNKEIIIDIFKGIPFSEKSFGPATKCDLVIEFPAGTAASLNILPGDLIKVAYSLDTMSKILTCRYNLFDI